MSVEGDKKGTRPCSDLKMKGEITQEVNKDRKKEGEDQVKGGLGDGVRQMLFNPAQFKITWCLTSGSPGGSLCVSGPR